MELAGGGSVSRVPRRHADGIPRCEFCQGKIRWVWPTPNPKARTEQGYDGKPMPLDFEPDPNGRYTLYTEAPSRRHPQGCVRAGELTRGQVAGWRAAGKPTFQRHFKTCPKKDQWGKLGKPYGARQVQK